MKLKAHLVIISRDILVKVLYRFEKKQMCRKAHLQLYKKRLRLNWKRQHMSYSDEWSQVIRKI